MNSANFVGRLVRDPMFHQTASGLALVRFTVAVNRSYRKQKQEEGKPTADFIPCVAWRGRAEIIKKYCQKGSQVSVSGRMQSRTYTDKQGVKRYIVELVVNTIDFLGSPRPAARSAADSSPYIEPEDSYVDDEDIPI